MPCLVGSEMCIRDRVYILTGWAKGPDNSLYALAYDGIFRVVKR